MGLSQVLVYRSLEDSAKSHPGCPLLPPPPPSPLGPGSLAVEQYVHRPALRRFSWLGSWHGMAAMEKKKEKSVPASDIIVERPSLPLDTTARLWGPQPAPKLRESLFVHFSGAGGTSVHFAGDCLASRRPSPEP